MNGLDCTVIVVYELREQKCIARTWHSSGALVRQKYHSSYLIHPRDSEEMKGRKKGKKQAAVKKLPEARKGEKEKKSKVGEHELGDQEVKACTSKEDKEASPLEVECKDDTILLEESGLSESKSIQEDSERNDTVEALDHALR